MKVVINIVLVLLIVGLTYLLAASVNDPILFQEEWDTRENAARDRLIDIRTAQQAYKGIVGRYAPSFDTLTQVLTTATFNITKVFGDPDATDPKEQVRYEQARVNASDSMFVVFAADMGFPADAAKTMSADEKKAKVTEYLNGLRKVPFAENGEEFTCEAYIINYQKTKVPVVKVSTPATAYMGKFADTKYKRYDNRYDPNGILMFGDLTKPSTSGNWRNTAKEDEQE